MGKKLTLVTGHLFKSMLQRSCDHGLRLSSQCHLTLQHFRPRLFKIPYYNSFLRLS
ncbi:hypothetical protein WN48_03998 [Eufriesea mexicana]|uniref:Uncharacterized protein n=1 Tax=Eufriesea mexicana TaxID=516756 RepID=A0A310SU69_9HYME|nr:hypothetical protein WN48_03998 [Eufriesea mexicana]